MKTQPMPRTERMIPANLQQSADELRNEAARARRLARTLYRQADIERMEEMAQELEERAARLEGTSDNQESREP